MDILSCLLLGLSLSAPIGPINAAQLDRGIRGGFWPAWLLGLGAVMADIVYILLVYFGVVHFVDTPFVKSFLWLFGFFVLVYIGIESLLTAQKITLQETRSAESLSRSFAAGFFMSLSNPISILFWLGIYGSILADTAATYAPKELMIFSAAVLSGVLLWDITMASLASAFRRWLTARLLKAISVISGLSLIGFGLYFGFEAAKILFFR
ncbi:LysE family transporter [Paenibacillus sp. YPG26]|uniref:LysE family transporter n=1 Tax=Paenibacillus sp. YPG26 TaxID=2878915 RepID=UPI002041E3D1|nr:LysE family transporter [Paenibacillus sp. YPG26]USB32663.1 LysE family translocator [Paenibacillus sp. YPG26]